MYGDVKPKILHFVLEHPCSVVNNQESLYTLTLKLRIFRTLK